MSYVMYSCFDTILHLGHIAYDPCASCIASRPGACCRGYIKHFFQCTDCAKHFTEMASEKPAQNVLTRKDAVLWGWRAHNEVLSWHLLDRLDTPFLILCP